MIRLNRKLLEVDSSDPKKRLRRLRVLLQLAIELEHATIPVYLYAFFSIKEPTNREIAGLIRSVLIEEMLHMSLDCNILNAIGGSPAIDNPKFIPKYPGHLPGGVEHGLIVGLAPMSKQLMRDVFMVIEAPPESVDLDGEPTPDDGITIGEFYNHIKKELTALDKIQNIFTGNPAYQLRTGFPALQNRGVYNLDTALAAIDLIISQGEGSTTSPLDPDMELAHYYRYAEIYYGRKLIPNPRGSNPPWVFEGHRIAFNPAGVQPVITNPSAANYKDYPHLADLNTTFNRAYSDLLRTLHKVFNGSPDHLGPALLTMQGLTDQARVMMATEIVPGLTAGPTFDYIPA